VWLDIEGTGVDPYRDRIVEICILSDDGRELETRVNPGVPIPQEATAVHGITDADVADAPRFAEIAGDLREAWGDVPAVPAVVESSDPDPVPPGALRSFLRWLGEEA